MKEITMELLGSVMIEIWSEWSSFLFTFVDYQTRGLVKEEDEILNFSLFFVFLLLDF